MTSFRSLSDAEFGALFRNFRVSAFRLETLQKYSVAYEETPFLDFLAGKERYTHPDQAEWANLVRKNTASGKLMSRVHVVTEPLSDYVRFELLWPYVDSVEAGEDVRILAVAEGEWPVRLPREDFWLFDSELVAVMHYDGDGRFVEAEMTDDSTRIKDFIEWRNVTTKASIGYQEYIDRLT